jgi:hypothetical protein
LLVVPDGNHNFGTLRCREREPSTPSAFPRFTSGVGAKLPWLVIGDDDRN